MSDNTKTNYSQRDALRDLLQNSEADLRAQAKLASAGEIREEDLQSLEASKRAFFDSKERRFSYLAHLAARTLDSAVRNAEKLTQFDGLSKRQICELLVDVFLEDQLVRNWHDKPGRI